MRSTRRVLSVSFVLALAWCAVCVGPAAAHPHMFVDAKAELVADAEGRVTGLRVLMRIDELTTLYVLEENAIKSVAQPLTQAQSAKIGAAMVTGLATYGYFTDLRIGDKRLKFSRASAHNVRLEKGKLAATLILELEAAAKIDAEAIKLSLYDPTYFAAVSTIAPPTLPTQMARCASKLVKFRPTLLDSATLSQLSALSREKTPDDPQIGAKFADRSYVSCHD
ncbi:MAG: DUF1007 family protein [Neomegalonema sp.]|nr:DUF1007 family protein [Neomegalonema sp.]